MRKRSSSFLRHCENFAIFVLVRNAAKYINGMTFGDLVAQAIKQAGISRSDFAKAVGRGPSWITRTIQDKLAPQLEELPVWADALGLEGQDRAEFIAAGEMAKLQTKADLKQIADRVERAENSLNQLIEAIYAARNNQDALQRLIDKVVEMKSGTDSTR